MSDIHRYAILPSTMQKAAELARSGCPAGTVVVASEQTAGQGRFGRTWHSEPGAGLYMSQVLRLKICPDSLPLVTLALGLATAEAITDVASVAPDLRWPNDVLIQGKKCAGILVQLHDGVLVSGIGINVNHAALPEELAPIATSLRIATGRTHNLEQLLQALIRLVDEHIENLLRNGKDAVLRAFAQASSYVRGRRVVVDQNGVELTGVTDGLDPQGFLLLRQENGQRALIVAGGVRPV
ncbi:MAG TPA: biotin--[acetyl-CoA-carboxylase] ligase [Bryobacteraceae bacterium]|nr:biotin--[acetyl-CoA-carboxylase] ligase [Bryobacteraceae bacterium]